MKILVSNLPRNTNILKIAKNPESLLDAATKKIFCAALQIFIRQIYIKAFFLEVQNPKSKARLEYPSRDEKVD